MPATEIHPSEATKARARYVETSGESNVSGTIRVECQRWTVDGLHHNHEFRYIAEASTSSSFIVRSDFVEHWLCGRMVGRFGWGHGATEAYKSSQTWRRQAGSWIVDLVSRHVFLNDLPCCGGKFVLTKERVGYSSISFGHCDKCRKQWQIGDGHHFMPCNAS